MEESKTAQKDFKQDIADITSIGIIPSLLNVVCQSTGMGFAAVARVTEDNWVTCVTKDDIGFGLKPGDELEIKTTICNEIRDLREGVVIDHVAKDPDFKDHHTPAMYGFQSYISMPIIRKDGSFFGTLCAIDPNPNQLKNAATIAMFSHFADLISFHLAALDSLRESESKLMEDQAFITILENKVAERTHELKENNESLEKMNKELQAFAYISSHDLQEPLRKIQTIASIITEKEADALSDKGKDYFKRIRTSAERMQSLINDLLAYSRTSASDRKLEKTNLTIPVQQVLADLAEEITYKGAIINAGEMCTAYIIPFQFHQLLHNLITNSLKFANPNAGLRIDITSQTGPGSSFHDARLLPDVQYCHIRVSDNGIGFEQKYSAKIFEMFQRLHNKELYNGTGIGLAIVKKIIENHNGFISADGKLNEGAIFDIYLPD